MSVVKNCTKHHARLFQAVVSPIMPFGIMAANALIAGIVCMTGTETFGRPTQETLDRGEADTTGAEDTPRSHDTEVFYESTL